MDILQIFDFEMFDLLVRTSFVIDKVVDVGKQGFILLTHALPVAVLDLLMLA